MTFSKCFSAFAILGVLLLSAPARADLAPEDQCFEPDVGKACDNATGDGTRFQPGICRQTMCTRATPMGSMTFTCYRCLAEDGGAGGQANESGGSSSAGESNMAGSTPVNTGGSAAGGSGSGGSTSTAGKSSAGSSSDSKSSDDGGCSVSEARGGAGALGGLLVVLGFAAAGLRRRRATS